MQRSRYFGWIFSVLALQQSVMCFDARAQSDGPVVSREVHSWSSLSPAQQTALQPLKDSWRGIEPIRKKKWIEIAEKFPTFSLTDQARIQGRMAQWAQISPSERSQVRLNYKEAQQVTPHERNAKWEAYLALPVEERESFATKGRVPENDANPYRLGTSRPSGASTNLTNGSTLGFSAPQPVHSKIVTNKDLIDTKTLLPKNKMIEFKENTVPSGVAADSSKKR
jgi:hypothetical protein